MAKFLKVKVSGLKELEAALNAIDHDLHKKTLKAAGKAAMEPVTARVRQHIPKDTGGLAGTIKTVATTDVRRLRKISKKAGMLAETSVGRLSKKAGMTGHQALNIEYGNARTRAQPFIRPAIQGKEKVVFMHFRKHLRLGIEKAAKKQGRRNSRL